MAQNFFDVFSFLMFHREAFIRYIPIYSLNGLAAELSFTYEEKKSFLFLIIYFLLDYLQGC